MLERKIRAHANIIENVPIFFGLLLLKPIISSGLWFLILGAVVMARPSHAIALIANSGVTAGGLIGTMGMVIPTVATAGHLIFLAARKL